MKSCYVPLTRCDFTQVTSNRNSIRKPTSRVGKIADCNFVLPAQKRPFLCKLCPSSFTRKENLRRHTRIAQEKGGERRVWNKSVECPVCKKIIRGGTGGLNYHLRRHKGETPFSCSICGKQFAIKSSLTSHMTTHTGVKPHSCEECGATFRVRYALTEHIRCVHRKERRFVCNICEATFGWQKSLDAHIKSHLNEKQHKCDTCNKWLSSAQSLRGHMKRHLSNRKTFKCSKCKTEYLDEENLKRHFLKKHGRSKDKRFACLFCEKKFCSNAEFEQHMRITHVFEKPFPCQVCSEEFATLQQLKYHKRVHPETARVFKCLECKKEFLWQPSLASHVRFFHRRQQYICKLCHKSFVNPNNLNRHMKEVHKKQK